MWNVQHADIGHKLSWDTWMGFPCLFPMGVSLPFLCPVHQLGAGWRPTMSRVGKGYNYLFIHIYFSYIMPFIVSPPCLSGWHCFAPWAFPALPPHLMHLQCLIIFPQTIKPSFVASLQLQILKLYTFFFFFSVRLGLLPTSNPQFRLHAQKLTPNIYCVWRSQCYWLISSYNVCCPNMS